MELGQGSSRGVVVKKKIKPSRIQKNRALRRKTQEKKKKARENQGHPSVYPGIRKGAL